MDIFSALASESGGLTSLRSFTLTIHPDTTTDAFISGTERLLYDSPLESFQVYATTSQVNASSQALSPGRRFIGNRLCSRILERHGARLKRFSFYRLRIGLDAVEDVCTRCEKLQALFILLDPEDLVSFLSAESILFNRLT